MGIAIFLRAPKFSLSVPGFLGSGMGRDQISPPAPPFVAQVELDDSDLTLCVPQGHASVALDSSLLSLDQRSHGVRMIEEPQRLQLRNARCRIPEAAAVPPWPHAPPQRPVQRCGTAVCTVCSTHLAVATAK